MKNYNIDDLNNLLETYISIYARAEGNKFSDTDSDFIRSLISIAYKMGEVNSTNIQLIPQLPEPTPFVAIEVKSPNYPSPFTITVNDPHGRVKFT